MRCAFDLQMIAKVRAEENAKAELLRQRQEDMARTARTIEFCEKLGRQLEEMAEKGQTPIIRFDCENSNFPRLLVSTRNDYADRRTSHRSTGEPFDLNLMKEWFAQYCFEVDCHKSWTWHYGCGQVSYYWVTISPQPQCLQ
jgi:hypothetical protein